jgi:stearoyl-CoA desaturase (delta-9 desaturase)
LLANVTPALLFFFLHWQLSVFFQSFFLHRYAAHRQFSMSKGWERVFHLLAWVVGGASYLSPRAYAIMHRMHHAYSDTPLDPHSPVQESFVKMMWRTKSQYEGIKYGRIAVDPRFEGRYPEWKLLDHTLTSWPVSVAWGAVYALIYVAIAPHWWIVVLLVPIHCFLGPIHGGIVNWFGHKHGYRNYDSDDNSRNALPFDVLTMGELFQNNHHRWGQSPNFGVRWFEIDPAYQVMKVLAFLGIIDMSKSQKARWEPASDTLAKVARRGPLAPTER